MLLTFIITQASLEQFSPGATGLSPVCEGNSTASIIDASDQCTSFEI